MSNTLSPFPTKAEIDETREAKRMAVMRAAVRAFNERGFHRASLDEVAASLGISKPTIYHYLGNKEQVLLECVKFGLAQLLEAADKARENKGNGLERLKVFMKRYAEINMDDFGRCVIRTGDEMLSEEGAQKFRALKREIDDALRALIQEGITDGSIACDDPKMLAFTIAGALNWPARWHVNQGTSTPSDLADALVKNLERGFLPRS